MILKTIKVNKLTFDYIKPDLTPIIPITWEGNKISVPLRLPSRTEIELHIVPHRKRTEVHLWYNNQVIEVIHFKP